MSSVDKAEMKEATGFYFKISRVFMLLSCKKNNVTLNKRSSIATCFFCLHGKKSHTTMRSCWKTIYFVIPNVNDWFEQISSNPPLISWGILLSNLPKKRNHFFEPVRNHHVIIQLSKSRDNLHHVTSEFRSRDLFKFNFLFNLGQNWSNLQKKLQEYVK